MTKSRIEKILIISLSIILALIMVLGNKHCYALSDVTEWIEQDWEPSLGDSPLLQDRAESILGVISVIGIVTSVGTLAFIGIRYIFGSVDEKASYKQVVVPWILGAVMVFTITTIPNIIYTNTKSIFKGGDYDSSQKWGDYIAGRDTELEYIYGRWKSYSTDTPAHFSERLETRLTTINKAIKKNDTAENRGKYDIAFAIKTYMEIHFSSREEANEFFEKLTETIEKIDSGAITEKNVDEEVEKYPKASGVPTTQEIRTRLGLQRLAWDGETYTIDENYMPDI